MTSVKTNKKGFTLVELVVVIAILAILAAIAIPVVNSIINTASKNGALSNAQTIELAVKECQADIAAKNTEVYNGGTMNDSEGQSVTIYNAKSAHASITIQTVAVAKGIEDAFDQVTYNGDNYYPCWDNDAAKCVFVKATSTGATSAGTITGASTTIEGEAINVNGTTVVQLAQGKVGTGSGNQYGLITTVKIDDIKTTATSGSGSGSGT